MGFFRGLLALKSLLIGLAILALWGRSYIVGDELRKGSPTQYVQVESAAGEVILTFGHDGQPSSRPAGTWRYVASREPREMLDDADLGSHSLWNRIGFGCNQHVTDAPSRGLVVNVMLPHWMVFLLAIPGAVRWVVRRHNAAVAAGRGVADEPPLVCPTCGQMFGTVPASCPVCGQVLAAQEFV